MRVLHFAGSYLPVPGGTTVRMRNMLASSEDEHVVVVPWPVATDIPNQVAGLSADETIGHVHVHRVDYPPSARLRRRIPLARDRALAQAFVRRVRSERVDIVHGHNPQCCAMASVLYKERHPATPMVYEIHGVMADMVYRQKIFGPLDPLNRLIWSYARQVAKRIETRVLRASDRLIAQTEGARRRLESLYGLNDKPVDVVRNGVDATTFDPSRWVTEREVVRCRKGWEGKVVCLYAGYLNEVNGIDFVLDALSEITGRTRGCLKVVLLGRGPCEESLQRACEEHGDLLEYGGLVGHEQMPAYYAACDVFMIPRPALAPGETFLPMKLLEAMAMEKLVVVSDVDAMAEVIQDGRNGVVFRKGDRSDFLRALQRIVEEAGLLTKLGATAREDVLREYTWERSREQLRSIYEDMMRC